MKLLERIVQSGVGEPFLATLERLDSWPPDSVRILTYHRIEDVSHFDRQMYYLAQHYNVIGITELLDAFATPTARGRRLPPRSVLITFDDAYRNFAECAWPVLRHYSLPVTLFVPTAYPDEPGRVFWWDRLEGALLHSTKRSEPIELSIGRFPVATETQRRKTLRRLKRELWQRPHADAIACTDTACRQLGEPLLRRDVLSWQELRRLAADGVTLGAHTRTHPNLKYISDETAIAEAVGSLEDLRRQIGDVLPVFAYPGGQYTLTVVEGLREAGFELAFTTRRGVNHSGTADPLQLRRNNIGDRSTLSTLRARLLHASPYLQPFRALRAF